MKICHSCFFLFETCSLQKSLLVLHRLLESRKSLTSDATERRLGSPWDVARPHENSASAIPVCTWFTLFILAATSQAGRHHLNFVLVVVSKMVTHSDYWAIIVFWHRLFPQLPILMVQILECGRTAKRFEVKMKSWYSKRPDDSCNIPRI